MALEGLRETLKEKLSEAWAAIQESSAFNSARENFESQTPTVQKAILFGVASLMIMLFLYLPLSYLSSASEHMTGFEENRGLIQGLLRASRTAKEMPPLPPPMDQATLRSYIERVLHEKKLVPEQINEIAPMPANPSKLAPAIVVQNGVAAQLRMLNLTQIVDLATAFQNLGSGIKLTGIDITPTTGQTHYYDFKVRVVSFGLNPVAVESEPVKPGLGGKRGLPARQAPPKDEADE